MDITKTDNDNKLKDLLQNLEVISNVKENDKIYIDNGLFYVDEPYFLQSFVRTYKGQTRQSSINMINQLIDNILLYLDNINEENNVFKENVISEYNIINQNLLKSIPGLQNLKITYFKDLDINKQIDFIIIKIQNRINNITEILK